MSPYLEAEVSESEIRDVMIEPKVTGSTREREEREGLRLIDRLID